MQNTEYCRHYFNELSSVIDSPTSVSVIEDGCLIDIVQDAYNNFVKLGLEGCGPKIGEFLAIMKTAADIAGRNGSIRLFIDVTQPFLTNRQKFLQPIQLRKKT